MTTAVDSLQPLVAWCDVPAPTVPGDMHIVRFYLLETGGPSRPLYYYGTLAFKRGPGQPRFDGTAVASIDPRSDPITPNPGFKEWFVKVQMPLVTFSGVVSLFVTFCDWDNATNSAGTELRTAEADEVQPSGDTGFNILLDGRTWQMNLRRSTVRGF